MHGSDPELYKQKCTIVQREIGLSSQDESKISPHVEGLRDELLAIDLDILRAGRGATPESIQRRSLLETARRNLIEDKVKSLRDQLSPEGQQRFDAYIEYRRRKIKFIPTVAASGSAPEGKPQQGVRP